ncbi:hypothetical protein B0H34DRAFT_768765, partial [Crassisporium funariophilum]
MPLQRANPEEEGPSYDSKQETPSGQPSVPHIATVDEILESVSRGVSEMRGIAAPIESAASAFSYSNDPNGLVGSISSLLKMLSTFNSTVDKIAAIHPYAQAAWTVLSYASKVIIDQTIRDDCVRSLLSKMEEVYTFLVKSELKDIESMKTVIECICRQTLDCSYFIREYSQNEKFRTRLLKNFISETDEAVKRYNGVFDELLQQFRDRAAGDTLVVVHRIWESMKGLDALAEDSSLNSIPYVSGAGLDTRKLCLKDTRIGILDEITAWINNNEDDAQRIFWLHGKAGSGKSFIAHTIANRFKRLERLGSCYCFNSNLLAEHRDEKIFSTIARDLADCDKQMRTKLVAAICGNTSLKHTVDILQQWKEFIMKPAGAFSEAMAGPIVIVIDALDESGMANSRRHLLQILAGELDDDKYHITKLPRHFRILLTSRPLTDIYNALDGVKHVRSMSMDDISFTSTKRDISCYALSEFRLSNMERIGFQEIKHVASELASASGGLFEWARLACAYVKDDVAGSTVEERWKAITTYNKQDRVQLLDGFYELALKGIFPTTLHNRPKCLERFRSVMGQILGTADLLPLCTLRSMRDHYMDQSIPSIYMDVIIKPMGALLSGTTDPSSTIRPLHASFSDFLQDKSRSGEFFIDLSRVHDDLACASLGVMKAQLRFNMCQLTSSYLPNSKVPDLVERVKKHISPELSYSCRLWTYHLEHKPINMLIAKAVREFFQHERCCYWLEALSLLDGLIDARLGLVIDWVFFHEEWKDILDNANNALRFVEMFGHSISYSTPHLYVSAIPFAPEILGISKEFADMLNKGLQESLRPKHNLAWPVIWHVLLCQIDLPERNWKPRFFDGLLRAWNGRPAKFLTVSFSLPDHPIRSSSDSLRESWSAVAVSNNGLRTVMGSDDGIIQMCGADTGIWLFKGHTNRVSCVAFSFDNSRIVSGSDDRTIRLWDAKTGRMLLPPLEGHEDRVTCVAFSFDEYRIVSGSDDRTVRLWDAKTG